MSSFCKDCSIKIFGKDFKDFKHNQIGLVTREVCEGCGIIWVDWAGRRVEREQFEYWITDIILMRWEYGG